MKKVRVLNYSLVGGMVIASVIFSTAPFISKKTALEGKKFEFPEIPQDNRKDALNLVAEGLIKETEKNGWFGAVEYEDITSEVGMNEELESMRDIIVALITERFQVVARRNDRDRIMKTIDELMKSGEIEWFIGGKSAILQRFIGKASLPDFRLSCELKWKKEKIIVLITCKLMNLKTFAIITSHASFYHPSYIDSFRNYQKDVENAIKKTSLIRLYSAFTGGGFFLALVTINSVFFIRRRKFMTRRDEELNRTENYIRTGQFIAAYKSITRVLSICPDDEVFLELKGSLRL